MASLFHKAVGRVRIYEQHTGEYRSLNKVMDLDLNFQQYHQVGVTSPRTLGLLPSSQPVSKIVIGDRDGAITAFGVKRGNLYCAPVYTYTVYLQ